MNEHRINRTLRTPLSGIYKQLILLSLLVLGGITQAQQLDPIRGEVVDKINKLPMAGVSVVYEGTDRKVLTDAKGYFSLPRIKEKDVLIFSYVGMETKKVTVQQAEFLKIQLVEKTESLADVLVTGYSRIAHKNFTGNSVRISGAELLKVNPRSLLQSIQTFDPSFRITENITQGSNPNQLPSMTIRGQSGMGITELDKSSLDRQHLEGNAVLPVFIVDGFEVPLEEIYDLDMTRIHSVNILKDAAATAMYGSRAANGLVVIETRSPEAGKIRVQYQGNLSITAPDLSSYNLMNAREKVEAERLAGLFDIQDSEDLSNEYYKRMNNVIAGVDTYWLSQGLGTGVNQAHSLYLDGGENDLRWGLEMRYDQEKGVMQKSGRDRSGAGFFVDYRVGKIQIRNKINFDHTAASNLALNKFSDYAHNLPYQRLYDDQGDYMRLLERFESISLLRNPIYEMNMLNNFDKNSYNQFTNNLNINWDILPGLKLRGNLSASKKTDNGRYFIDPNSASYSVNNGSIETNANAHLRGDLRVSSLDQTILDGNLMLMYNRNINKHNLNLTLAANAREAKQNLSIAKYRGFPAGNLNSPNYAAEIVGNKPTYTDRTTRLMGTVFSANYAYNNIYLADIQGRIDGSSEFGSDRRISGFWATGLGINLHNYDFLAENDIISFIKVRGSYGLTGKTNFPTNSARDMYTLETSNWYPTGYGVFLNQMGNTGLKWERKYSLDFGTEIGLFQDKISLRGAYYNEETKDLITNYTIPSSTGFSTYRQNMGSVVNKGIELFLRIEAVKTKNWLFNIYGNFAKNQNRIKELSESMKAYNNSVDEQFAGFDPSKTYDKSQYARPYTKYHEGASLSAIYGMRSLGISPSNGKELFLTANGELTSDWSPSNWTVIGDTEAKGRGSFGFNLSYKKVSLFSSFLYEFGGYRYNQTLVDQVENANIRSKNVDRRVLTDRWQQPGDLVTLKDIKDRNLTTGASSRFVQKYNMLQLNALNLSYQFDQKLAKKWIGASQMRLTASTNNLFTTSSVKQERGLDYPYARSFNFLLNVSF